MMKTTATRSATKCSAKTATIVPPLVSVIIPIFNGSPWIDQCFRSIIQQKGIHTEFELEVCVCNDCSTDNTSELLNEWKPKFTQKYVMLKIYRIREEVGSLGVGYAKNRAVQMSSGEFLCFQDIDDQMASDRIVRQLQMALVLPENTLIGSNFVRSPKGSTKRFSQWANNLKGDQLELQVYTSNGPTIIMPTWFCCRQVYELVGGFAEDGHGTPEDLIFFYKLLDLGGHIYKIPQVLLVYTYHLEATTFSIRESTIWNIRIDRLQRNVLLDWHSFTIWNAGKQGRRLYKSLWPENQKKVLAFCDIDSNKINKYYCPFDSKWRRMTNRIPIVDFRQALPPLVICVKLGMTNGVFERNLSELQLQEGTDYILFS